MAEDGQRPEQSFEEIQTALKKSAATLRDAGVAHLLAGSLAAWARGGPETDNDLDFVVPPDEAKRALEALEAAGMRTEIPPEDWLYKAYDVENGDAPIDVIFRPAGVEVDDRLLARGEEIDVLGMSIPVMALEDVFVTKLLSLKEHYIAYEGLLLEARALREKVAWQEVRERTAESPFATAFFVLLEGLDVLPTR
jgi:Nucleotidyl transferase of unknown function (DUF2204)